MPRLDVERATGVREPVLAVVHFGEADEELGCLSALLRRHVLARTNPVEHRARVLLLQRGIVVVDVACAGERASRAREIARQLSGGSFVAKERQPPRRIVLDRELQRVHRERLVPLPLRLEELAERIDRERALRVELLRPAKRLDRFLGLRERRVAPEPPQLFVHSRELASERRVRRDERSERFASPIEERDERFDIPLLAIELREALGRDLLGRVLVDRHNEHARRTGRVAERGRPDVGRFAQPVRGVAWVVRLVADLLEKERIRLRIRFSGSVRVRERLLIVRIRDEALDERFHFRGIHFCGGS